MLFFPGFLKLIFERGFGPMLNTLENAYYFTSLRMWKDFFYQLFPQISKKKPYYVSLSVFDHDKQ